MRLRVILSLCFVSNFTFAATYNGSNPYRLLSDGTLAEGVPSFNEAALLAAAVNNGIVINGKASIFSLSQTRSTAAVYVNQAGFIDLGDGTSVTADSGSSGRQPGGIRVQRSLSTPMVLNQGESYNIIGKNITVDITGSKYRGVSANNGYIYLSGLTTINGNSSDKIAYSPSQLADTALEAMRASIFVENLNIKQGGINGVTALLPAAIVSFENGNITVYKDADIVVIGDNAYGVYVNGDNAKVNFNNMKLNVSAVNGTAMLLNGSKGDIFYKGKRLC